MGEGGASIGKRSQRETEVLPSRAGSLPHWNAVNCGSEPARDGVITADAQLRRTLTRPDAMRSLALSRFFGACAEAKKGTRSMPRLPPQL